MFQGKKVIIFDMDGTLIDSVGVWNDVDKKLIRKLGALEEIAEGILVKMTCYMAEFNGQLQANSEIQEINWLSYADLEKISPVDKLIFKDLYQKGLLN